MERAEQSDLIMLLLNLSFIPDSVIGKLEDFKHGWQAKFLQLMDDYKQQNYEGSWRFQDPELEEAYIAECQKRRLENKTLVDDRAKDA